jgi:hypothetical protein
MLDPRAHAECLEFIRAAIASSDPETAQDIAAVLREVCASGHADRNAIWADLSPGEREQFRLLVSTSGSVR